MHLISVDFSKNNLLTEQLGFKSLYELNVFDKLLIEHQLCNFVDIEIDNVFLINNTVENEILLFNTQNVADKELYKHLLYLNNNDIVIIFRNDVYFETCCADLIFDATNNDFLVIKDFNDLPFFIITKVGEVKKIINKSFALTELFTKPEKFSQSSIRTKYIVKRLDNVKNYKKLLNFVLNGKAFYKPPFVAEGIYIESKVPVGDFSIIPPVYIATGAQIESGSVIGPNTVIYKNTLISENTVIRNSVLFENVFISSNCFVDGTICCYNASVKRNSAVFSGSVIGVDSLIGEDIAVENNSIINKNIRYDKFYKSPFGTKKTFKFNEKFQGLPPDKVALLGSAFATVFKTPKILVAGDGEPNSLSLKLAFMSGFVASGGECLDSGVMFKSQVLFASAFCDCDYSVYFYGSGGGTDIIIYDSNFRELSKSACCNLFDFCNSKKIVYAVAGECKTVRQVVGLKRMYLREILSFFNDDLPYVVDIVCENKLLYKSLESIFNKLTNKKCSKHKISVYMNDGGTNVNIILDDVFYSGKILKKIAFFYLKEEEFQHFKSDIYNELWKCDSVILLVTILNIMNKTSLTLPELLSSLPDYHIKSTNLEKELTNSQIAEKIVGNYPVQFIDDCFKIRCKDAYIKIKKINKSNKIKVLCSSENMSVSEELCNKVCGLLQ